MDKGIARSLVDQLLLNDFPADVSREYRRGAFKDKQMHIAEFLKKVDPHNFSGAIDYLYRKVPDFTGLDDQPQPSASDE
ncbi:MAG: hypothetical protein P8N61_11060 [Porticoccaceae bacterium]|nr:hypothetical protein [Porticoccaceae bacterium]